MQYEEILKKMALFEDYLEQIKILPCGVKRNLLLVKELDQRSASNISC